MKQNVILYGAGGHSKVVTECLIAQGLSIVGFVDDSPLAVLFDYQHMGTYKTANNLGAFLILSIGNNNTRQKISRVVTHHFVNAIHPSALVSSSSRLGKGCMVLHRAIIQASVRIGDHVIVNTGAQIDHDGVLGDFVHIGPGVVICGNVTIGEGTLVGAGAVLLPGVKIGKWSTIGAGAVVTKDIPSNVLVTGVPALAKKNS